ncbi:DsrE family protein [Sphingomonas sp. GlSt437]|uniref:DsrE family protein n=1 Tax=Sphingomonas sp. GlSt437 TaxID=3389970 RepID=UPI003A8A5432
MTGLTIVLVATDDARVRAALTLACAQAALGGRVRLFAQDAAVVALGAQPRDDDAPATPERPDRRQLLALARQSGVALIACQTGLAETGLAIDALAEGTEGGGLVGLLATLGEDRLVVV